MPVSNPQVIRFDYDDDPGRFRTNIESMEKYSLAGDIHASVAERLASQQLEPVLDIGCGEGRLEQFAQRQNLAIVALDRSLVMLKAVTGQRVLADANHLPFPDGCFRAVAALYMLYHMHQPQNALRESCRILKPGGVFIACAPSRYKDPELASIIPPTPLTFDAEHGPEMIGGYFEVIKVERWDAPFVQLPDKEALAQYLRGRQASQADIQKVISSIPVPLALTKRGALIYAQKR